MAVAEGLRGPPPLLTLIGFTLYFTILLGTCSAQVKVLTPPYFNLASGKRIQATATCGVNVSTPEQFCRLTGVAGEVKESDLRITINSGQLCEECDPSEEELSHPAEFAIDGTERWWQSPPLSRGMEYNAVNLSIDLEQEFLVAYVFIKMANSPRPGVWILERSTNFGKTWMPWQYFAGNPTECNQWFDLPARDVPTEDDEAICTTKFSKVVPLENGEIIVSLVDDRPNALNFSNSQKLQDWTKATSVRLRMIQTKTLLGHLMAVRRQDPTVTRRYFYSIKDISIGGRCVCNGHAESCDKADPTQPNKLLCRCQHNTCGPQCEVCCPGFVQKKWQRVTTNKDFMCERCNCHRHSQECIYDPEVDKKKMSLDLHGNYDGGGVCQNCRHNTEGINCENCKAGFYRPYGVELDVPDTCQPCQCDLTFSTGSCEEGSGRCLCKPQFTGENCDRCSVGYHTYPDCFPCDCHVNGTEELICEVNGAQCPCKDNYIGRKCDMCRTGFFDFPNCHSCACNRAGSRGGSCDVESGQCQCQLGFSGRDCGECAVGYHGFPNCQLCECEVNGCTEAICDNRTGSCLCKDNFQGARCNLCVPGFYQYPYCHECGCVDPGSTDTRCHDNGQCVCKRNFAGLKCDRCAAGYYKYPECIRCNCDLSGTIGRSCDQTTGQCQCRTNFEGLQCDRCKENFYRFPRCVACNCNPAGAIRVPGQPLGGCGPGAAMTDKLCECKERVMGNICDTCKPGFWDLDTNNKLGCRECGCNKMGTIGGINVCDVSTGQCMCKVEVTGRNCDQCRDGTYSLIETNPFGCKSCDCNIGGSATMACNKKSGQCICKPRVTGMRCDEPIKTYYFPTLHQHQYEIEDGYRPGGGATYFAFSEIEFPQFSWKGYAIMSEKQPEILIRTKIHKPALYRLLIRYHNKGDKELEGKLTLTPRIVVDTEQYADIVFKPTTEPSFTKVTDISSTFVLNPGKWTLSIKVPADQLDEELLLDYLVLIPQQYYEATVLQDRITRQCVISKDKPCLHYRFPTLMGFPTVVGIDAYVKTDEGRKIKTFGNATILRQLHSTGMAIISTEQKTINMDVDVPETNMYIIVVNYHNPTKGKNQMIDVTTTDQQSGTLHLHECPYSTLCRQVVKIREEIGRFNLTGGSATITLTARSERIDAYIDSMSIIPVEDWTQGYIRPNIVCIKVNGECISSEFITPVGSDKIEAESGFNEDRVATDLPEDIWDEATGLIKLDGDDTAVDIVGTVRPNQHVMVVHYYQPTHPGFDVQVTAHTKDREFIGVLRAKFCSSATGCRAVVEWGNQGQYFMDIKDREIRISFNSTSAVDFWLDYVMLISSSVYTPDVLEFIPIDKSAEFLSECVDETFNLKPGRENLKMCRNRLFALTSDYNNGALHCRCNVDGSLSFSCKAFGGQCRCRPNIIGRDCSACRSGYYGFPRCRRCRCTVGTCHPIDGTCICPPRVTGKNCDKCLAHTFGYDKYVGCQECGCNPKGVRNRDLNCDQKIGQCKCLPNIEGRHCDHCVMGHYDFPWCQSCKCDPTGTEKDICDQTNGRCLCKENTEKPTCANCRAGAFYMEEKNPKGCTLCFCFGTTQSCDRSRLTWDKVYDMDNWKLKNSFADVNVHSGILNSDIIGSQKNDDEAIYWSAPSPYLGNKITSYGGKIKYTIVSEESDDLEKKLPGSVVILEGNNMTLAYMKKEEKQNMEVELREYFFVHEGSGSPVKREQFMMALVNLEAIYIKGTYYKDETSISLKDVQMDVAKENGLEGPAYTVEQCNCPPSYEGTSCEKCAPGHYRQQTTPFLGLCSPCECNGHSDECDPLTGECLACRDNTEGAHCEKCKEGYYGHPPTGGCQMCSCPHPVDSNNFAVTCHATEFGVITRCECKPGYTGVMCDKCDSGHYGRPNELGDSCRKCGCSGNIDPSLDGSCDHETGSCLICANNSTGSQCELCRDWWYGDAVQTKNCRACACDRCGTESCDNSNGVCRCKENVVGLNCDRCPDNYYGFHSCEGCKMCECGEAATSTQCDDHNGQCVCQPGVVGQKCDKCREGYWNYKATGCDSCNCLSEGSVSCDPETGSCICQPGFRGVNCDQCDKGWVHVPGQGCVICDKCTKFLTDELDQLTKDLTIVQREMRNVSVGVIAISYLTNITNSVKHYKPQVVAFLAGSTENVTSLKSQMKLTDSLKERSDRIHDHVKQDVIKTANTLQESEDLVENSKMINDIIKDVIDVVETTVEWVDKMGIRSAPTTHIESYVQIGAEILEAIQLHEHSDDVDLSASELETAKQTLETVREVVSMDTQENHLNETQSKVELFTNRLYDLQRLNRESKENSSKALSIIHMINSSTSGQTVQEFYSNLDHVEHMIKIAKSQLQGSLDFINDLQNMTTYIKEKVKDFKRGVLALGDFLDMVMEEFMDTRSSVANAVQHADKIENEVDNLEGIYKISRTSSVQSVNAANAYKDIIMAIEDAMSASKNAHNLSSDSLEKSNGIGKRSSEAKAESEAVFETGKEAYDTTKDDLAIRLEVAVSEGASIKDMNMQIEEELEGFKRSFEGHNFKPEADAIAMKAMEAEMKAIEAGKKARILPEDQKMMTDIPLFIAATNESIGSGMRQVETARSLLPNITSTMNDILNKKDLVLGRTRNASLDVKELRKKIELARSQANQIIVGLKMFSNTTLRLRNPPYLESSGSYSKLSMNVKTDASKGLLTYIGGPRLEGQTQDFLSLELENGHVVFRFDLGSGSAAIYHPYRINDGKWHHIEAERIGTVGFLTVEGQAGELLKVNGTTRGTNSVMMLRPAQTLIYVGGYPTSVQLPDEITRHRFVGAVERFIWNDYPLGLWNFLEGENNYVGEINRIIPPPRPLNVTKPTEGYRFDGDSYVQLDPTQNFKTSFDISFHFNTYKPNGLIMLMYDTASLDFTSVDMRNGQLVFQYDLGGGRAFIMTEEKFNDGKWHTVQIKRLRQNGRMVIDSGQYSYQGKTPGTLQMLAVKELYVGGYSDYLDMPRVNVSDFGFTGCIKNLQFNSDTSGFRNSIIAHKVIPGCPELIARSVNFPPPANNYISKEITTDPSRFHVTMKIRTEQSEGLLLYAYSPTDDRKFFSVFLEGGRIKVVSTHQTQLMSKLQNYNDGNWHYISVVNDGQELALNINDEDMTVTSSAVQLDPDVQLYFGGFSTDIELPNIVTRNQFHGCIEDVTINGKFFNFALAKSSSGIRLNLCPLDISTTVPSTSVIPATPPPTLPPGQCRLPLEPASADPSTATGFRFGTISNTSRWEVNLLDANKVRDKVSIEFQTKAPDGILMYAADKGHNDFMSIYLKNGYVNFAFNCGSGKGSLVTPKMYNDGKWHKVQISRNGKKGTMSVDSAKVQRGSSKGSTTGLNIVKPLYFGGLSAAQQIKAKKNLNGINQQFTGCMRNIETRKNKITKDIGEQFSVQPCSSLAEFGTFIGEGGGYLQIYNKFHIGTDLEFSLEVKPRTMSGVLASVYAKDFLLLELVDGVVQVTFDNGAGAFTARHKPQFNNEICNGRWHKIEVFKAKHVAYLKVDGIKFERTTGKLGSSSADTTHPLYIGGMPEDGKHSAVKSTEPFVGCIRNVKVKSKPVNLVGKMSSGNVQFGACSTI